jgi:hypothetical protein
VLVVSLALVVVTHAPPRQGRFSAEAMVADARAVRVAAHSHISLVADLYWIRMASLATAARQPYEGANLIRWGEFITDLDPGFMWAYVMGGVLGTWKDGEQVYNAEPAARLLEKGTTHVADFRLNLYLGYLYIEMLDRPLDAARTLEAGARLPRAPPFLGPLATRLYASRGAVGTARKFAEEMVKSPDPEVRAAFELRLRELDREEVLAQLEAASAAYQQRFGRPPPTVEALVRDGVLPAIPSDPLGGEWVIDGTGAVRSSSGERLRVFHAKD